MATHPAVVYLDTSDISLFADVGSSHLRGTQHERECIREVYEYLQQHVEQGDIEVRFSGFHIGEITKSELQEAATRKAQVIERLCGGRCFRPFEEIWAREVWQLIGSSTEYVRSVVPYEVHSDHGFWLIKSTDSLNLKLDLDAMFRRLLKDSLSLNRKGRRALKAQLWRGHRLSERGLDLSRPHWPDAVYEIASKFPVNDPQQVVDIFVRRSSGLITDETMENEFAQMLLQPTQMVRFIFEMNELRKHCPQFVISFGQRMVRAVQELRTGLALAPHSLRRRFPSYVADTLMRGPALEAALRSRRDVPSLRIADEQIREIVQQAPLGDLPAVDLISVATKAYAAQHATTERKPKDSDGPDLLHLTYLPYSDVFRADVYTAEVLRQCDSLASAKVARSLEDLPALIERHVALAA